MCCVNALGQQDSLATQYLLENKHKKINNDIYIIREESYVEGHSPSLSFNFHVNFLYNKKCTIQGFYLNKKKIPSVYLDDRHYSFGNYLYWDSQVFSIRRTRRTMYECIPYEEEKFMMKYTKNKKTYWVRIPLNSVPIREFKELHPHTPINKKYN